MHTPPDPALAAALPEIEQGAAAWFARLRRDDVSAAERAEFAAWLEADPAHRQAYAEVCALWDSPGLAQVLGESRLSSQRRPARSARPHRRQRLAWAAAAGFAACALWLWQPAAWECLQADYCTGIGETKTVALADGSQLTLNTASAVRVELTDAVRHVWLARGEALFEVTPDAQRPFLVDAPASLSRVKGTRFIVRAGQALDSVTVISGVVEVSQHGQHPALLRADQQIQVAAEQPPGAVRSVAASSASAWLKGKALFDNAPLSEVVAEIARYRRGAVLINNPRLKTLQVSGRFDLRDTDNALESLAQTLPIRLYRITPWLVVIA